MIKPGPWVWSPGLIAASQRSMGPVRGWALNEGSGAPYDFVTRRPATVVGAPVWTHSRSGRVLRFDGVDDNITTPSPFSGATEATFVIVATPHSGGSVYGAFCATDVAYNAAIFIGRDETIGLQFFINGNKVGILNVLVNDTRYVIVGTFKGGAYQRLWVNGRLVAEDTSSIPTSIGAHATLHFTGGGSPGGGPFYLSGSFAALYGFNRAIDASGFLVDPFGPFRPAPRIFSPQTVVKRHRGWSRPGV